MKRVILTVVLAATMAVGTASAYWWEDLPIPACSWYDWEGCPQ